ncbi:MAG: hypothetical protein ABIG93_01525 [archaeon]|nr:hypothetical protein [Nanoarchaeota archaeon]
MNIAKSFSRSVLSLIIIGILVSLLSSLALADSDITSLVIENTISFGESAEFNLSITNNAGVSQSYTIYSLTSGQGWSIDPYPLSDKVVENVAPGKTYTTSIRGWPLEDFEPGIYYLNVQIDGDLGESYEIPLKVYFSSMDEPSYFPSLDVEIDIEDKIDPQEVQSVLIHLENRNPLNLSGLVIKLQSEAEGFNAEREIDLAPLESKTLEFTIEMDPFQQPKDYYLFVTFEMYGETVKVEDVKFEVVSLETPFTYELEEETIFLKKFQSIVVENDGNSENTQKFKYQINGFQALFVKSEGDIIRENGNTYLAWDLELKPGEAAIVQATYNYRLLLYLAIFFVAFLIFYFFVRSPIVIRKGVITTEGNEGALNEIKIALEIKNKSKKPVNDLTVTDTIPGIANLEKSLDLGTLKPQQVLNTKQGTKIVWNLAELEAKEHRIITYKVRTKLNVLGTFKLPRAVVEFNKKRGNGKKAYSNVFRLDAGKVEDN